MFRDKTIETVPYRNKRVKLNSPDTACNQHFIDLSPKIVLNKIDEILSPNRFEILNQLEDEL